MGSKKSNAPNERPVLTKTQGDDAAGKKIQLWMAGLLTLISAVFYPSLKIPFLLDDYQIYIEYWPSVSWDAFFYDITHHFQQNRLLTHASWYLQMLLGASDPYGFHCVNMVMHGINTLLVFQLARAFGSSAAVGLLTAAFFAVHPSNMEAVSYIYGRSDLQVTAFIVSALILFKNPSGRLPAAAVCLAGAVLTKESAVVAPALYVMAALVLGPNSYPFNRRALLLSLFAALVCFAEFFFLKTDHADNFGYGFPGAFRYLMLQPFCLFVGLIRMAVPAGFYIVYQFELPAGMLDPRVMGAILFWAGMIYFSARQYRRQNPVYLFAVGWYLSAMAPTNSIVPRIDQLSDRHIYLALIGPLFALASTFEAAWRHYGEWIKRMAWGVVIVFGALTFLRNLRWQSAIDVWKEASGRFPNWSLPARELATEYGRSGDLYKKLEHLEQVARKWPANWTVWNNLGVTYAALNRLEPAARAFAAAVPNAPERHKSLLYHNMAFAFQNNNNFDSAIEAYRQSISHDPKTIGSRQNLAVLLWHRGDVQSAEKYLREVLALNPHVDISRWSLALLLIHQNRPAEAKPHLEELLDSKDFEEGARQKLQEMKIP